MSPSLPHLPTHLLLADDHPLIRSGMHAQLEPLGRFRISQAWDASSLQHALASAKNSGHPVDLALVDVLMPGMAELQSLLDVCSQHPSVGFLVVTGLDAQPLLAACQKQPNVRGLIDKSRSAAELRSVVDLALAGVRVWPTVALRHTAAASKSIANYSIDSPANSQKQQYISEHMEPPVSLTPRLHAVASCVARGLSNAQIGHELGLTEGTVKAYLKDIFKQIGVSNRTQLALRCGTRP